MTTLPLAPAIGKQCAGESYHRISDNWGENRSCKVKAKYREDGKDWCHVHAPSLVAQRHERECQRWDAEDAERSAKRARQVAEHAALAGIANPAAVPEVIAAAQLAYGVLSGQLGNPNGQHATIRDRLQKALLSLDKKEEP